MMTAAAQREDRRIRKQPTVRLSRARGDGVFQISGGRGRPSAAYAVGAQRKEKHIWPRAQRVVRRWAVATVESLDGPLAERRACAGIVEDVGANP